MRARAIAYVNRTRRQLVAWVGTSPVRLALLLLAGGVLLDATVAAARPGGGQNYSGGGGGGGGDSGGAAVVIHLAIYLLQLCVEYPAVGFPILGLVVVGGVVYHYSNANHRTRAAVRDLEASALATAQRDLPVRTYSREHGCPNREAGLTLDTANHRSRSQQHPKFTSQKVCE